MSVAECRSASLSPHIRWHVPDLLRVIQFGFCPGLDEWEGERDAVLAESHVEIGPYPDDVAATTAFLGRERKRCVLVSLRDDADDDPADAIGCLAHEAVHVVEAILERACETAPGEETRAYLTEHVVRVLTSEFLRTRHPPWLVRARAAPDLAASRGSSGRGRRARRARS